MEKQQNSAVLTALGCPPGAHSSVWQHPSPAEALPELSLSPSLPGKSLSRGCDITAGMCGAGRGKGEAKNILSGGKFALRQRGLLTSRGSGQDQESFWNVPAPMEKEPSNSSVLPPPDLIHSSQSLRALSPLQAGLSPLNIQISFKNELIGHKCQLRVAWNSP